MLARTSRPKQTTRDPPYFDPLVKALRVPIGIEKKRIPDHGKRPISLHPQGFRQSLQSFGYTARIPVRTKASHATEGLGRIGKGLILSPRLQAGHTPREQGRHGHGGEMEGRTGLAELLSRARKFIHVWRRRLPPIGAHTICTKRIDYDQDDAVRPLRRRLGAAHNGNHRKETGPLKDPGSQSTESR